MNFKLQIIDTVRKIYDGEASKITIPATGGEMTVLPNHMPLVTPVGIGEVVVETPEKSLNLTIAKGIFSIEDDTATLLIEDASFLDEISEAKAEEAKKRAEEIIEKGVDKPNMDAALATLRRSALDLQVLRKRKITRN
jgi:F-type H+-transporting ATPase subunit epsilon